MEYKIYLAGPITGCSYNGCTDWRNEIRKYFPEYIRTYSPMRGKSHLRLSEEKEIQDYYENNPLTTRVGINTRDHNDVYRSDLLLVNFIGAERVSIGTVMEIAWAHAYKKPIVIARDPENDIHEHSMIHSCTGFFVKSLEEAAIISTYILSDDKQMENYLLETKNSYRDVFINDGDNIYNKAKG